jgi:hypothetical protein
LKRAAGWPVGAARNSSRAAATHGGTREVDARLVLVWPLGLHFINPFNDQCGISSGKGSRILKNLF